MKRRTRNQRFAALALVAALVTTVSAGSASARDDAPGKVQTVTVTVVGKDKDRTPSISPTDFAVYRGKARQEIVEVKGPGESPVNVAVLIQEGLAQGVGNELDGIKKFILGLPEGSQVMVGYLRGTGLSVRQPFTADLEHAADSLRIPSSHIGVGSAPFIGLIEALERFDGLAGRNQVVMISNGLELNRDFNSASPSQNLDLDRAIAKAQRRGIPVWSLFANSAGQLGQSRLAASYGQGALNRLSDETGGKAFFAGLGFVTFDHALETIAEAIDHQYLIAYRGDGKGKLDVTVETPGVKVRHAD